MSPFDSDTALPGFERSLAVVIGINSYAHGIPPLLNAVRDANAVADSLERQGFEVLRLLDSQATLSSLSHLMSHHLSALESPPDRLLLYFAGHGLAHTDEQHQFSGFLLPADARRDDTSSYWPMASLREALRHLPCRHLLLILDCCFAGAFPHSPSRDIRAPSQAAPLYLERFRHFSSRRSFQLLLSTAHDELASDRLLTKPAQESLGDGLHSPFALALLQSLQPLSPADTNQDGLLTAAELYTFLRDRLLSLLPSHCQQTPSLWPLDWHDGGEFLFLLSDSFPSLPPAAPLSQHSNPYLGLRPFSSAQRHLFFGRERLVDSLLERLRAQPLLLLCGPSGVGKSSLVHAGLLPRLIEDPSWRVPPSLRPSSQPFHALSSWLASLAPNTTVPSAADLASQPRSAADFLGAFLSRYSERSVLLVIDPLEELVTACLDDSLRKDFLRTLSGLLQLSHPRLHVLLLLRSDFEPHFLSLLQPSAIPYNLWHGGRLNLPPMNRDELRRCIEKPAEACVLFFSPGLVERLLDDVEQMPGALPLLSVALSELFDAYLTSGRNDRTLCFEDYHHIGGGIAGALQRRAELVFSGAPPPVPNGQLSLPPVPPSELPAFQRTLRNVLLRMVSTEGGELARRRIFRAELEHPEYPPYNENSRVQRVLSALETCRLVVASDDGGPCVEPAHDALLSAWPRLHGWAHHAKRELILLRRVSFAASDWLRNHRNPSFLWADTRLSQLEILSATLRRTDIPIELPTASQSDWPSESLTFNAIESGFLRASAARQRLLRNRRNTLALTTAACILALIGIANSQTNQASRSATEAQEQQRTATAYAKEIRNQTNRAIANARLFEAQALLDTDPTKSLLIFSEVVEETEPSASISIQTELHKTQPPISHTIITAHEQTLMIDALLSPDGSQVLTNIDDAVQLWPADGSGMPIVFNRRGARLTSAVFSPDGTQVLTISSDHTALIYRVGSFLKPLVLKGHTRWVNSANFSPDGSRVITTSNDGTARIWRSDGSGRPTVLRGQDKITSAIFSPDGSQVLTVSNEGAVRIWRSDGSGRPIPLDHAGETSSAIFSPDGSQILTASKDGTARIWRSKVSGRPIVLRGHTGKVTSATFSPNGSQILTASKDGTARIWRSDGSSVHIIIVGRADSVTSATFSPNGSQILTVSDDGIARIWHSGIIFEPILLKDHESKLRSATFSPDGSRVLTASDDGTARIWRSDGSGTPLILKGHTGNVRSATFSSDGSQILTTSADRTVRIWRPYGFAKPAVPESHESRPTSVTLSPDGSQLITFSNDISYLHRSGSSGNNIAIIWRADGSGMPISLEGHTDEVRSATFSPDGSQVLTSSNDGTARIWRSDGSGTPIILKGHTGPVRSANFSPDGSQVITASNDGTARIWRSDGSGTPIILELHTSGLHPVPFATFIADGSKAITTSDDGTARIWGTDGSLYHIIHGGRGESFTISPDGSQVITTSNHGAARIWRTDGSDAPIALPVRSPLNLVAFSPDGSRVFTVSNDNTIGIWRIGDANSPLILGNHAVSLRSATFSPDGSRVLTTSYDGAAYIWHADQKAPPLILRSKGLSKAIFHPDGSRVVTLSDEGVLIWFITPSHLSHFLRKATTACLSTNERKILLFESPNEARERHLSCELSHGRLPLDVSKRSSKRSSTGTLRR